MSCTARAHRTLQNVRAGGYANNRCRKRSSHSGTVQVWTGGCRFPSTFVSADDGCPGRASLSGLRSSLFFLLCVLCVSVVPPLLCQGLAMSFIPITQLAPVETEWL